MTTWHSRLELALSHRGKTWADLFDYMNHSPVKLKKPSVYAWKPNATKRSTMMDGENAALVCKYLEISPMWLFHNAGSIENQDQELMAAINDLSPDQKGVLLIGLKMGALRKRGKEVEELKPLASGASRHDHK